MDFWKVWAADKRMLAVQAFFWTIYALILQVRNVWMPADGYKYSVWHVIGMLIVVLCVFYTMAWLFWILAHSSRKTKWTVVVVSCLLLLVPVLGVLFYRVFPNRFYLWFFDPEQLPSIGMFVYRVSQKYFHFSVEAALLVSRYVIQNRARENAGLIRKNHALHVRFITGVINPHFLMNTLQAINSRIAKLDGTLGSQVGKLAEILHYGLGHAKGYTLCVPLADEVTHARNYLDILSYRFQRDFSACLHTRGDLAAWMLPPITLTTLLENVFAHGAVKTVAGTPFTLTIDATKDRLAITCCNTRRQRPRRKPSTGMGIGTTRQRLQAAFAERATIRTHEQGDKFITVIDINRSYGTTS